TFVSRDLPDVVVENFNFNRTMGDRNWRVVAVSAEHKSGIVRAAVIDLHVDEPTVGRKAAVHAISGEFVRDDSEMLLFTVDGTVHYADGSADVAAPVASYDAASGVWFFPSGMELFGENAFMTGNIASIDAQGVFHFEKGVRAEWTNQ
ncbi:hypothetical protein LJC31_08385, partial [Synergistaceae bacterium OttesenSCG-928-I11]|nr:hypothetical protein [Synergistaceae bacterium OttesenSCG-928-I11]